ncbi:hypothetical protein [Thalassobacillus sp. CUG 92003]|uniref:hypothetical protein n=1 Tax=Thalassobacillus sp. CUG 92003 TaxID=2736641 RepID=UPI0015E6459C|nr:hypothetical protein [Thalassobacillus sp. CUG 92003]
MNDDDTLPHTTHPSPNVLKGVHLVKKSAEAYNHAKDIVNTGSPIAEDILQSCLDICQNCVEEFKRANDDELEDLMNVCMINLLFCEKLKELFSLDGEESG